MTQVGAGGGELATGEHALQPERLKLEYQSSCEGEHAIRHCCIEVEYNSGAGGGEPAEGEHAAAEGAGGGAGRPHAGPDAGHAPGPHQRTEGAAAGIELLARRFVTQGRLEVWCVLDFGVSASIRPDAGHAPGPHQRLKEAAAGVNCWLTRQFLPVLQGGSLSL